MVVILTFKIQLIRFISYQKVLNILLLNRNSNGLRLISNLMSSWDRNALIREKDWGQKNDYLLKYSFIFDESWIILNSVNQGIVPTVCFNDDAWPVLFDDSFVQFEHVSRRNSFILALADKLHESMKIVKQ